MHGMDRTRRDLAKSFTLNIYKTGFENQYCLPIRTPSGDKIILKIERICINGRDGYLISDMGWALNDLRSHGINLNHSTLCRLGKYVSYHPACRVRSTGEVIAITDPRNLFDAIMQIKDMMIEIIWLRLEGVLSMEVP